MFLRLNAVLLAACCLTAAGLSGCGPSGPKLYPVKGTVTVKGKPAAHALVFLHRAGKTDLNEPVPYGKVGDNGEYVIATPNAGEGAQTGDYTITVYWPDMTKPEDGNGQRPDALNGAYDKPGASKLKAQVKAEPNTLPPLDLTPAPPQRKPAHDPNDK